MNGDHRFYNPLDCSQIAFIPTDLESIDESESTIAPSHEFSPFFEDQEDQKSKIDFEPPLSLRESLRESSRESLKDSFRSSMKDGHRDSYVPSVASQSIFSDAQPPSILSSMDELDRLSSVSSGSSCGTNMSYAARYKIVLKLTPREINLIQESWGMMLNDELAGDRLRTFLRKVVHELGALSWVSGTGKSSRKAQPGLLHGKISKWGSSFTTGPLPDSDVKPISSSSALASSIFCHQFYGNLLYMEPSIESMFPSIRHQAVAFAGVLTMTVNNLENLSVLEAYLCSMGKRHARILAIEPPHFELMGMAFLKTIKDRFGVHSTLELEETWSRLYSYLANSILQFGIDPVLKIDALKNEMTFPVPDLIKGLPITKSMFQPQQPIPQSSHTSTTQKLRKNSRPENVSPLTKPPISSKKTNATPHAPQKNANSSELPGNKRDLGAVRARSGIGKRDNDKDCVIM